MKTTGNLITRGGREHGRSDYSASYRSFPFSLSLTLFPFCFLFSKLFLTFPYFLFLGIRFYFSFTAVSNNSLPSFFFFSHKDFLFFCLIEVRLGTRLISGNLAEAKFISKITRWELGEWANNGGNRHVICIEEKLFVLVNEGNMSTAPHSNFSLSNLTRNWRSFPVIKLRAYRKLTD